MISGDATQAMHLLESNVKNIRDKRKIIEVILSRKSRRRLCRQRDAYREMIFEVNRQSHHETMTNVSD